MICALGIRRRAMIADTGSSSCPILLRAFDALSRLPVPHAGSITVSPSVVASTSSMISGGVGFSSREWASR